MNKVCAGLLIVGAISMPSGAFGDDAGCINALNRDGAKVARSQGKVNRICLRAAAKGRDGDAQACLGTSVFTICRW